MICLSSQPFCQLNQFINLTLSKQFLHNIRTTIRERLLVQVGQLQFPSLQGHALHHPQEPGLACIVVVLKDKGIERLPHNRFVRRKRFEPEHMLQQLVAGPLAPVRQRQSLFP